MKILDSDEQITGEKRQYIPQILQWDCPECGKTHNTDFTSKYISYPVFGEPQQVPLFCLDCDEVEPIIEPEVTVNIEISVDD